MLAVFVQALAARNASLSADVGSTRDLLAARAQQLSHLTAKAANDAAIAASRLAEAEATLAREREQATVAIDNLREEVAQAAVAAREAGELKLEETGGAFLGGGAGGSGVVLFFRAVFLLVAIAK